MGRHRDAGPRGNPLGRWLEAIAYVTGLPMYAWRIGLRYLLSKKRSTVSVITVVAVGAVALGVGALLAVLSITSGFQDAFRAKVLGVNAHVLVLKYGLDFEEYRDVIAQALDQPEVAGAGPFVINEMMLAKGDRLSNVLVKGVDPDAMPEVLDLPEQITRGSLSGLRVSGRSPPVEALGSDPPGSLDEYLREQSAAWDREHGGGVSRPPSETVSGPGAGDGDGDDGDPEHPTSEVEDGTHTGPLPEVDVPTLEEAETVLSQWQSDDLADDAFYDRLFDEEQAEDRRRSEAEVATESLPGIVVGATLARNLDVQLGDRVRVISPLTGIDTSLWAPEARTPRSSEFRVIAIFEAGFQEYDTRLVYVDLFEAQHFLQQGDTVTGVELRLHELERAPAVAERIELQLGGRSFSHHGLGGAQPQSLYRAGDPEGRTVDCDRDDHRGGRLLRDRHPHHGGSRKAAGDRYPQSDGCPRSGDLGDLHDSRHRHRPRRYVVGPPRGWGSGVVPAAVPIPLGPQSVFDRPPSRSGKCHRVCHHHRGCPSHLLRRDALPELVGRTTASGGWRSL